jgi:SAM-dependent methyltransferase/Flp pilus assembly protein TadD
VGHRLTEPSTEPPTEPTDAREHARVGLEHLARHEWAAAAERFARSVTLDPGLAESHLNWGVALAHLGETPAAAARYRQALACRPDFPEAHVNLAGLLAASGDLDAAERHCRAALGTAPELPAAQLVLGRLLQRRGDPAAAAAAYEAAARAPGWAEPWFERGRLAWSLGRRDEAVTHYLEALTRDPAHLGARQALTYALARHWPSAPPPAAVIEASLDTAGVNPQEVAVAGWRLVLADPVLGPALHRLATGAGPDADLAGLAGHRLLHRLLVRALVASPLAERACTALRARLLERVLEPAGAPADAWLGLLAALGCQGFRNGYAFRESPTETAALARVRDRAETAGDAAALAAYAMYRPLAGLPAAGRLRATTTPHAGLDELVRVHVRDSEAERAVEPSIPSFGRPRDTAPDAVRAQYEAHPYPGWLDAHRGPAGSAADVLRALFPHAGLPARLAGPIDVLVAGCGTGKHAVLTAQRFRGARVTAIDVSRRSLAYAARQARDLDVEGIEFLHGDVLDVAALARAFDAVECVGVLHHLADPEAGWRALLDVLRPDGVMKIGLYSALGRQPVVAARDALGPRPVVPTDDAIRAARQVVLDLGPAHPAWPVTRMVDFYSIGGCRDLLFHARERAFALEEIAALLERLGLVFLGFELEDPAPLAAYAALFPDDPDRTDLGLWQAFEEIYPETFRTMYQFWCGRGSLSRADAARSG